MGYQLQVSLLDWERFQRQWRESQSLQDAIEGSERIKLYDDNASTGGWFVEASRAAREALSPPAADALAAIAAGLFPDWTPGGKPTRDLEDDYAYGEGGFEQVFSPESVRRLAGIFAVLPDAELEKAVLGRPRPGLSGEAEQQAFLNYLRQWRDAFGRAARESRGLATRLT